MVDITDLKSVVHCERGGSSPPAGTIITLLIFITTIMNKSNSTTASRIKITESSNNFKANVQNTFPNSNYIPGQDQEDDEKELKHEQNDENQSAVIPQTTSKEQEKSLEEILELLFGKDWQTRGKDGKSDPSVSSVGNQNAYHFTKEDDGMKFAQALQERGIACKLLVITKNKDGKEQTKQYASVKELLNDRETSSKGIKITNTSKRIGQTISSHAHNNPKSTTFPS